MIEEGQQAPDFELQSDSGDPVRLRDLRGRRVILYFYPKDDTPGCTKEACGFRDSLGEIDAAGAVVLGVSPDTVESHVEFRDKHGLNFPLLADPDHSVASAYGVWGRKKFYGRTFDGVRRSTFIIDANGVVERVYARVKPATHAMDVLADL
jgi:peroxiredoxin Q/BCP